MLYKGGVQFCDLFLCGRNPVDPTLVHAQPHVLHGMDDEQVAFACTLRHDHADAREVIFERFPIAIPAVLREDARRIVTLCLPFHAVPRQVRAAQVDAEQHVPVANALIFAERHIPARAAVQLAQHELFAQLPRNGRALDRRPITAVVRGKVIDAGIAHILVKTHHGAGELRLYGQAVLVQDMPG